MVINGKWNDTSISVSVKENSFTFSYQSGIRTEVYSFDGEGRLWTAMVNQISYRRGLDGKVVAKWMDHEEIRNRRWLRSDEADQLTENARSNMILFFKDLLTDRVILDQEFPETGMDYLHSIYAYDSEKRRQDVQMYLQVYRPIGILPPDQYMAVVLQATEGCSFNTCTYCDFYRDRPFRIKRTNEFQVHALAVKNYLGRGLSLRRTIFLGDANALVTPISRLIPLFETVHELFDVKKLGGIYAFLDGFSGNKKSVQDFKRLKSLGLERVYIGMESGHAPLLKFLNKPGEPKDVLSAVQTIKSAGVSLGIIVLLGAGGHNFAQEHIRDTTEIINRMDLDKDDIIYFSELIESEGLEYVRRAYQAGINPMTAEERISQGEMIERGLDFGWEKGTPHISRYDIRDFVY